MNFSMFLPQTAEEDVFNASGQQADDINSVVEYLRVALGYDHTADDEDDDSGQNFHLASAVDYFYQREISITEDQKLTPLNTVSFAGYRVGKLTSPYYDIIAPPPEA